MQGRKVRLQQASVMQCDIHFPNRNLSQDAEKDSAEYACLMVKLDNALRECTDLMLLRRTQLAPLNLLPFVDKLNTRIM